ncbi:MAG: hypothetical protein ACI92G_000600 [Candidatus Pelagisphaera sp.]|jgi:hypothetical protein
MKKILNTILALTIVAFAIQGLQAGKGNGPEKGANFGMLYYDGGVVGTVATPTSTPGKGIDTIYAFPEGAADGQLNVTTVAPGDKNYHGGRWAVHVVAWNVPPMVLSSAEAVEAAESIGYVTITRVPAADFVCPVRKNG